MGWGVTSAFCYMVCFRKKLIKIESKGGMLKWKKLVLLRIAFADALQ